MNEHNNSELSGGALPAVRTLPPSAVYRWIRLGWKDLLQSGWPSFLHGLILVIFSVIIIEVALLYWPLLPGAVSGFLIMGPILSAGLFALSRQIEKGQTPRIRVALDAWLRGSRCLMVFGLLLVAIGTAWVGISKFIFHLFVDATIERPMDFLRYVVMQGNDTFFEWTLLAGLVIALIFAFSVVSVQLLVDRDVNTKMALNTSLRAVGENPFTMLAWSLFLLVATIVSLATFMLGFLILYPLMGHASWHAYKELVDTSDLPHREF